MIDPKDITPADADRAYGWALGWHNCEGWQDALTASFAAHRLAERAAIVAWLRVDGDQKPVRAAYHNAAHAIERGDHEAGQ